MGQGLHSLAMWLAFVFWVCRFLVFLLLFLFVSLSFVRVLVHLLCSSSASSSLEHWWCSCQYSEFTLPSHTAYTHRSLMATRSTGRVSSRAHATVLCTSPSCDIICSMLMFNGPIFTGTRYCLVNVFIMIIMSIG